LVKKVCEKIHYNGSVGHRWYIILSIIRQLGS
jgi:hypothetical protein